MTGTPARFDNSYARLPAPFFTRTLPTSVRAPRLIRFNQPLADELGLSGTQLAGPDAAAIFAGNLIPDGADPISTVYAGHQFGGFSPRLGDGRAILLGEVAGRDIQLKGAGPTPYSRSADGRAAVGPVLREYIVSEAMHAFGVPTTRSLAAVTTGEFVLREVALPGAVLTRVASSHIRVGTFQYFAARGDVESVRVLAEYVVARHYPEAAKAERPAVALLAAVVARQAALIARWMGLGFIHGVMNTDNMSVAGETIDYGPCAFLDAYDSGAVFSSIDHAGRYAYGNQPRIALWNCTRFAEALLPLMADDQDAAVALAQDVLAGFAPLFETAYHAGLRAKLGLATTQDGDAALAQDLLSRMAANAADFTLTFRNLGDAPVARALFADPAAFDAWHAVWQARRAQEPPDAAPLHAANPAFIPRNHLVEEAIVAATERDDFAPFEALLAVLARPFDDQPGNERYALPARPEERVLQTFCGT